MLLNNDYYLDTKQMIMSKEISSLINNTDALYAELMDHVRDDSLHGKDPIIIQNITQTVQGQSDDETVFLGGGYNSDALANDAIYYIPITYNAGKINNIISNIPHNLNTHTIVFLFVIPDEYILDENDTVCLWVYKLNEKAIRLYKRLGFEVLEDTKNRYYMKYSK